MSFTDMAMGIDKAFLARDMPELIDHLHYRIVDVSSLKELAKRWYPRAYFQSPDKRGGHRVLADILESTHTMLLRQKKKGMFRFKKSLRRLRQTKKNILSYAYNFMIYC